MADQPKKIIIFQPSDRYLKLLMLVKDGSDVKTGRTEQLELEPGLVVNGRARKIADLKDKILELYSASGQDMPGSAKAVFVVPEELCYIHDFTVSSAENNINSRVRKELAALLPMAINDLIYTYRAQPVKEAAGRQVMVMAANRVVLEEWQMLLRRLGIEVASWERETVALYRGVFSSLPETGRCLLDMKEVRTIVSIFTRDGLAYSYIDFFGLKDIDAIFKRQRAATEKYLRETNLANGDEAPEANELRAALAGFFDGIEENISFFTGRHKENVAELVLLGELYKFNGLAKYFQARSKLRVYLGQPIQKDIGVGFLSLSGAGLKNLSQRKLMPTLSLDMRGSNEEKMINRLKNFKSLFSGLGRKNIKTAIIVMAAFTALLALVLLFKTNSSDETAPQYRYHLKQIIPISFNLKKNKLETEVLEVEIKQAMATKAAAALALGEARAALAGQAVIEPQPINLPAINQAVIYPYTFQFLAYNRPLAQERCLAELDLALKGADFSLDSIDLRVEPGDGDNFVLQCTLEFYTSYNITPPPPTAIKPEPKEMVMVRENVLGNVNIRSGPGVTYAIITRARAGQALEKIEAEEGWTHIDTGEINGWIISSVLIKQE